MKAVEHVTLDPIAVAHEAGAVLAEHAEAVDEQGIFPEAGLQELKRCGLMGLLVPREYGGWGASIETMSRVARVLSSSCLSTGMIWAMHCQQVATIVDYAPAHLRAQILPRIAYEGLFIASVTTEREKGGHLLSAHAPLHRRNGHIELERDAPVVTGGAYGDAFLITMRADEDSPPSEVVLVYAEREQLQREVKSGWLPLGMRGTQSVGMRLRGDLPHNQVIDPEGGFERLAVGTMIPVGHIAWASAWLGAAQGCFRQMIDLLRDPQARKGFPLQSDLFAARLARVRLELDTVSMYLQQVLHEYQALRDRAGGSPAQVSAGFNIHINNLKLVASETLFSALDQLMQIAGLRYGYMRNGRLCLERTFRDLRSASMMYANDRLLTANGKLALLDRDMGLD